VWTPYTQYLLMVALAYISRNSLIDWILNIQWNILITNFPASVPTYYWLEIITRPSIGQLMRT